MKYFSLPFLSALIAWLFVIAANATGVAHWLYPHADAFLPLWLVVPALAAFLTIGVGEVDDRAFIVALCLTIAYGVPIFAGVVQFVLGAVGIFLTAWLSEGIAYIVLVLVGDSQRDTLAYVPD